MAVVSEVRAVVDLVKKGTEFASYLTETWYKSSQAMEQFPRKLKTLEMKIDLWSTLLQRYGMSQDLEKLLGMLHATMEALDEETTKLQQLRMSSKKSTRWYNKAKQNLLNFPSDLTTTIQSIIDTLDETYALLKMEGEAPNVIISARRHWPGKLRFGHDSKYVPLTKSVDAVRRALENPDPPRNVVFLLGVSGSGKTSLVKGLTLFYQDSLSSQFSNGVFFLDCGRGANSLSKLRELVYWMGFPLPMPNEEEVQEPEDLLSELSLTPFLPSAGTRSRTRAETLGYLQKGLSGFLEKQKLLIVLDDVWETELLEDMLVSNAEHVKYLITTQCPGLWGNSLTIEIARPSKEDAEKILANHAELGGQIPPKLQEVADELIESADSNPLVLANLAWSIVAQRRPPQEEKEWKSTWRDLPNLIEREDDAPFAFGVKYPRSVSSSIMMAVSSLPPGAQTLLCLCSALCESPYVPEIVLELLFSKLTRTPHVQPGDSFLYCSNMLEGRALIVRQDQNAAWSLATEQNLRTWTIHDLRQIVIRSRMQDKIDEIFGFLLRHDNSTSMTTLANSDEHLSAALIFIFGEQKLSDDAGGKLGVKTVRNSLMKTGLEPLIWLLQLKYEETKATKVNNNSTPVLQVNGDLSSSRRYSSSGSGVKKALKKGKQAQSSTDNCTQELAVSSDQHERARQALLQYVREGQLDEAGMSGLLASSDLEVAAATCEALRTIAETHDPPAKTEENQLDECVPLLLQAQGEGIIRALLKLVQMNLNPGIQRKAGDALGALAIHNHQVILRLKDPSALSCLVALLDPDVTNPSIQASVGTALSNLADSEEAKKTILTFPRLLDKLLDLLDKPNDTTLEEVQMVAAFTIARLAHASDNRKKIAEHSHALRRIVGLLATDVPPKVQLQGVRVLSIVSVARKDTKKILLQAPDALDRLLSLMCNNGGGVDQAVQQQASVCIANLTLPRNNQFTSATIVKVLEALLPLLSSDSLVPLEVQQYVAKSWANLAVVGGEERKYILPSMKGALPTMVNLLNCTVSAVVQEQIICALEHLAMEHSYKLEIASSPRALSRLVALMAPAACPRVQNQAASLLALLACAQTNKILIASTPGLLENSVTMMARDELYLQRQAVRLLGNLTVYNVDSSPGTSRKRRTILTFEGILPGLVKLLGRDVDPTVQRQVARSMGHLANDKITSVGDENKVLIAAFPGALEGLVALLADSSEPNIRLQAARSLGYIAFRNERNRLLVAKSRGALEALVHSLECVINPSLQEQAAWALVQLAASPQNRKSIAAAGAVEGLLNLLTDPNGKSPVQRRAARALTLIDHEKGVAARLHTGQAHAGRGHALLELSMHKEALEDLKTASQMIHPEDDPFTRQIQSVRYRAKLLKYQCVAKAMLEDYQGALQDADTAVELEPSNIARWHERGVLKALIGEDLEGALEDLNKGDKLVTPETIDGLDAVFGEYHRLKHRGWVKFKLGDDTGALADATCASRMTTSPRLVAAGALGKDSLLERPVKYLDFEFH